MEHNTLMIITQIALGISLSACAGLRAFLPLLIISILARMGNLELGPSFSWLASTQALIAFGTATVIEIAGDKIPAVDHVLDSIGIIIKPAAGTLLFSSAVVRFDPLTALVMGLIAGGSLSELIHLKKASLRAASSGLTLGIANPVISIMEDLGTLAGTVLSILVPLLAALIIFTALLLAVYAFRKLLAKKTPACRAVEHAGGPATD